MSDKQKKKMHPKKEKARLSQSGEERQRLEKAVRQSEKYVRIVNNSPDIIYVLDHEGRFIFLGGAMKSLTGYSPEELIGKHFTSLVWPDDVDKAKCHFNERRTGRRATRGHQIRLATSKGKKRDFDVRSLPVRLDAFGMWDNAVSSENKKFYGTYGVARDITARVQREENLKALYKRLSTEHGQRRALSKLVLDLLEEERDKIAVALHDEVAQTLAALKIDLENMRNKATTEVSEPSFEAAEKKLAQVLGGLRRVIYGLKPVTLDSMGLIPSLRTFFEETENDYGIRIQFFTSKLPQRLDPAKELAIFRVAQEALTNVVRHAGASEVHVNLTRRDKTLSFSVEDNGTGFNVKAKKRAKTQAPLGLLIMEERIAQLGGVFTIDSSKGHGTHLLAEIPL
jgi:PAS domain S-box-containing protein